MKFLDLAKVIVRSGAGGNGCIALPAREVRRVRRPRRRRRRPGGDVIVEAVEGLNTLIDFRYQQHFFARNGQRGRAASAPAPTATTSSCASPSAPRSRRGRGDRDRRPHPGRAARRPRPGRQRRLGQHALHDLHQPRAPPRQPGPGGGGAHASGCASSSSPTSGSSACPTPASRTFLAATSNARPKIADYPFTTLVPTSASSRVDGAEFVIADIPGLIEGASEGRGLGDRFLGHVERCAVLLHLVDGTSETVADGLRDHHQRSSRTTAATLPTSRASRV